MHSRAKNENLYSELDILQVKEVFVYIIMYRYINGMLPEVFMGMFTSICDVHDYDTRQATTKNTYTRMLSSSQLPEANNQLHIFHPMYGN